MEILSKPIKIADDFIQITKILDKFGHEKMQLRYYRGRKGGSPIFKSGAQTIYFKLKHWKLLKKSIRSKGKEK